MNWQAVSFDWNHIRAFLATAEEGSLSAAARSLGTTQPTLSRQVTALEEALDVILFERGNRSMDLTSAGIELLEHVKAMGDAAFKVSLAASGQIQSIDGHVAISSTSLFASYHLPHILERIRAAAPDLEIEIVASNEFSDLRVREADIAIRHTRPEHGELIAKRVGATTAHIFAAKHYLERVGKPQRAADLVEFEFVGFGEPSLMLKTFNGMGVPLTPANFKLHTREGPIILDLIRKGLGAGVITKDIGDTLPDIEVVLPEFLSIDVPVWLVTHRELRTSRRIRLVFDEIAEYCKHLER
ncbi:MAG: LysR family transcriptional regulator [Pseudomonadota bacterium]